MDEIELNERQAKGARAEELLRNELLQSVFANLRSEYIRAWSATHFKNSEGRERLWQAVQIVGKVQDNLKNIAINGRLATKDLSRITSLKR